MNFAVVIVAVFMAVVASAKRCDWQPPRDVTNFSRCYHGCQQVVRDRCTYPVLPCATTCSFSSLLTKVSIHTTGVTPVTTVQTCTSCTVTVAPIGCTTLVVCNPAQTTCDASFASYGSTLQFSTSDSTLTADPPGSTQSAAAASLHSVSNVNAFIVLVLSALVFTYLFGF
jgi:hypothetical protein